VPDVPLEVFRKLLEHLYPDTDAIPSKIALPLFSAADRFGVERLRQLCIARIQADMDVDSACTILSVAAEHHATHLKEDAVQFIVSKMLQFHPPALLSSSSFIRAPVSPPPTHTPTRGLATCPSHTCHLLPAPLSAARSRWRTFSNPQPALIRIFSQILTFTPHARSLTLVRCTSGRASRSSTAICCTRSTPPSPRACVDLHRTRVAVLAIAAPPYPRAERFAVT